MKAQYVTNLYKYVKYVKYFTDVPRKVLLPVTRVRFFTFIHL